MGHHFIIIIAQYLIATSLFPSPSTPKDKLQQKQNKKQNKNARVSKLASSTH